MRQFYFSRPGYGSAAHSRRRAITNAKLRKAVCEVLETRRYLTSVISSNYYYDSVPHQVQYTFDTDVSASLIETDQSLINLTTNEQLDSTESMLNYDSGTNTASFTYPEVIGTGGFKSDGVRGSLPDGNYESILTGDTIHDAAGNPMGTDASQQFFFLAGDINRDRVVDDTDMETALDDYFAWQDSPYDATFSTGDLDYDGSVSLNDVQFASQDYGVQLPLPPDQPNELTATAATPDPSHQITLDWTAPDDTGDPIDGFRIWRSTDGINFTQVHEIDDSTVTNWTDTGLTDGTKYTYRVRAFSNTDGDSESTNKASAVTVLPVPTSLSAVAQSDGSMSLTWTNNAQSATNFYIQWAVAGGDYSDTNSVQVSSSTTHRTITGLLPGVEYKFHVRAYNSNSNTNSAYSLDCTATTVGPLQIQGPESATAGDTVTYQLTGENTANAIWAITSNGTPYTTGKGASFTFEPNTSGSYAIEADTLNANSTPITASTTLNVKDAPFKVSISTPSAIFAGRPAIFASTVSRIEGAEQTLTYHWKIGDADGNVLTIAGRAAYTGDLPTYLLPPNFNADKTYTATLTVSDGIGSTVTAKRKFTVLADPGEANYDSGFGPVAFVTANYPNWSDFSPDAVAQQADGKILVAGNASGVPIANDEIGTAFIARYNTDLTPDTSFGTNGIVLSALGGAPGEFTDSTIWKIAVDPTTQNIVVAGTVRAPNSQNTLTGISVARYLPSGTLDPTFHQGSQWMYLPHSWGTWSDRDQRWIGSIAAQHFTGFNWSGMPYDVAILPDQSILVGGTRTKLWLDGTGDVVDKEDDFLLMKLSGQGPLAGQLDTNFHKTGFAESVNPMNLPNGGTWEELTNPNGPPTGFTPWVDLGARGFSSLGGNGESSAYIARILPQFDPTGNLTKILVGGSAFDWSANAETSDYKESPGGHMDFVLAQYDADGSVDTLFGQNHSGKVTTGFPGQDDVRGEAARDDFLSNLEILPTGDILAVGATPSTTKSGTTDTFSGTDHTEVPNVLALAWYTSDGHPDTTLGSDHSGIFVSPVDVVAGYPVNPFEGYKTDPRRAGLIGVSFDPTGGKILASTPDFAKWFVPGDPDQAFGDYPQGWAMAQFEPEISVDSNSTHNPEIQDTTFGSLGDGRVTFSPPQPESIGDGVNDTWATGAFGDLNEVVPTYSPAAILSTADGIVAVGTVNLANWTDQQFHNSNPPAFPDQAATSMIIRYRTVTPTPTDLEAAGVSQQSISLTWKAPTDGDWFGYQIERAPAQADGSAGQFKVISYANQAALNYLDADQSLQAGTTYYYRVRALAGTGPVTSAAGPAEGSTLPDLSNYGLVDTIVIPPDGAVVRSGKQLINGLKYLLRISGHLYAVGPDGHQYVVDGEYVTDTTTKTPSDVQETSAGNVDVGVAIDKPGTVKWVQTDYTVDEDVGIATFRVERVGGLVGNLNLTYETANYVPSGAGNDPAAAVAGTDYDAVSHTLPLPEGVSSAEIQVTIHQLTASHPDRAFLLKLIQPGTTSVVLSTATVTIKGNIVPVQFGLSPTNPQVTPGDPVQLTIKREDDGKGPASIRLYTFDGTAIAGTDYTEEDETLTFASGSTSQTVTIPTASGAGAGKFFSAWLAVPDGQSEELDPLGTYASITFSDSASHVGLDQAAESFRQDAGDAIFNVSRTKWNDSLSVPYHITAGSAVHGQDFDGPTSGTIVFNPGEQTEAIDVPILDDGQYQADSTFTVSIDTPNPDTTVVDRSVETATITTVHQKADVQFSSSAYHVSEHTGSVSITLTRANDLLSPAIAHYETSDGTAHNSVDYQQQAGNVTFAPGETSKTITVGIINRTSAPDDVLDFSVALTSASDNTAIGAIGNATVSIDDRSAAGLQFDAPTYQAIEGQGNEVLTVVRSGDTTDSVGVHYRTIAGTAVAGTDYVSTSDDVLTIPAGAVSGTIAIPIIKLDLPGGPKTFQVELFDPSAGTLLADSSATVTIKNDLTPGTVYFPQTDLDVANGVAPLKVLIRRTDDLNVAGTVAFATSNGDAIAGTDYTSTTGTASFNAGDTFATITIPILDHALNAERSFSINLVGSTGGLVLGSPALTTVHIEPSSAIGSVQFSPVTYSAPVGQLVKLTLTRSGDTTNAVSVKWSTIAGTARPFIDFGHRGAATGLSGTAVFSPHKSTTTITIPITATGSIGTSFAVALSDPVILNGGSAIEALGSDSQAFVTLAADPQPAILNLFGGGSGDTDIVVFRSGNLSTAVTVGYEAVDGNGNYFRTGTISFSAGAEIKYLELPGLSQLPDEVPHIRVRLVNPSKGATIGLSDTGTFSVWHLQYYPVDPVGFSQSVSLVNEASGMAELTVTRTGPADTVGWLDQTDYVEYDTQDGTAFSEPHTVNGVTVAADYSQTTGVLKFEPGDRLKTILIPIAARRAAGGDKSFTVSLSAAPGHSAPAWGTQSETVVISHLTDASKSPFWGPPSSSSDHAYETLVDTNDTDSTGHLVLDMRNGEYGNVTTDSNDPLTARLYEPLPAAISQLTAFRNWSNPSIDLSWAQPQDSGQDDYYRIERSQPGAEFQELATVGPGTTRYSDTDVSLGVAYTYRIIAVAKSVESKPSNLAYAMLVNHPPIVENIGTQLLNPDQVFQYQVKASDEEDGSHLTYSRTVTRDSDNSNVDILDIDENGNITPHAAWKPSENDIGNTYTVTVTVADQSKFNSPPLSVTRIFTLAVVAPHHTGPAVTTITPIMSADGRSATLTSNAPSGQAYEWQFVPTSDGPTATILDPADQSPTINFTAAGTYHVVLRVTMLDDPDAPTILGKDITVTQQATSLYVSPVSSGDPNALAGMSFPSTLPSKVQETVVGSTNHYFTATSYDQFGNVMLGPVDENAGPHPSVHWQLYSEPDDVPLDAQYQPNSGQVVPLEVNSRQTGIFKLVASRSISTDSNDYTIEGSIAIDFTDTDPPAVDSVDVSANSPSSKELLVNLHENYTPDPTGASLDYEWTADESGVSFANNGESAAKDTIATFSAAGMYHLHVTVRDPINFLTSARYDVTVTVDSTQLLNVTPSRPTVSAGGSVDLKAKLVDQFGNVMAEQPSAVDWTLDGDGTLTHGVLTATYKPPTSPSSGDDFVATVHVSVDGFPEVDVPIRMGEEVPPTVSLSVKTTADTLLGTGGPGSNHGGSMPNVPGASDLIDGPEPVMAIISDPSADSITWTLTATPQGGDGGTVLLEGSGPVGSVPAVPARIDTIDPSQLPDGIYTITLTARGHHGAAVGAPVSASQVVQIRSVVKLGNLTLPVTDLKEDVPGADPITISRTYDSQRSGQNTGLGFGWTLDTLSPGVISTQTVQYDGQDTVPGQSGPGTSLAWNDLIYLTAPGGAEHVFAFRPKALIETGSPEAGAVAGVVTYLPEFVPVDGSNSTLQVCDSLGNIVQDDHTILWDSGNGSMFKVEDDAVGPGYNPALHEYGGYYRLTNEDGTKSFFNAATGHIVNQTDALGRVQGFADGQISATQAGRHYKATPVRDPDVSINPNHNITSIVYTDDIDADTRTVTYAYDGAGDLTHVRVENPADPDHPLQSTTYTYDANHHLIGAIDGRGVDVLTASYDPKTQQLASLTNVEGTTAKTSNGYTGDDPYQTTTDPSGDLVSNEYDDHGNVIRSIKTIMDSTGKTAQSYVVTISQYTYGNASATDDHDRPLVNVIVSAESSQPFTVTAARGSDRYLDIDALVAKGYLKTYSGQGAASSRILWATKQKWDPETRHLTYSGTLQSDSTYLATHYAPEKYLYGKPYWMETWIDNPWGDDGNSGIQRLSKTENTYDTGPVHPEASTPGPDIGLLTSTKLNDGQTTYYIYGGDKLPGTGVEDDFGNEIPLETAPAPLGMLYGTYVQLKSDGTPQYLTLNTYYDADNATTGAVNGMLESTADSAGLTTTYKYDPNGLTTSVWKSWTDASGSHNVQESATAYDALGRVTHSTDANGKTTTTSYDDDGHVLDTTDIYGGVTHNVYNAAGNLVQTIYPDHTETRSVYDDQGRVIWQTDRFISGTTYNASTGAVTEDSSMTANATYTIYDAHGNVTGTERHEPVQIAIADDPATGVSGIVTSSLTSSGSMRSVTATVYDAQGRTVETTDAAGLRTGTIYYDDGQVHYTGELQTSVSDKGTSAWYTTPLPTGDALSTYLNSLFVSYTTNVYEQTDQQGILYDNPQSTPGIVSYDSVTDALGHQTRTYKDNQGRTIETAYADGTYDQTLYSPPPSSSSALANTISSPADWNTSTDGTWALSISDGWTWRDYSGNPVIPAGYSEVVHVGQRMPNSQNNGPDDRVEATIDLYDASGRLVDVWLPAVADASNSNTSTRPHWHYDYDANGNQIDQIDPKGHETTFTYDCQGNELSRTLPTGAGEREHFTYDSFGREATHTDFDGNVATYTYFTSGLSVGLLQQVAYVAASGSGKANQTVSYTYDALGRQASVADASGTTTNGYDDIGDLIQSATPEGIIFYSYNDLGQHTETYTNNTDILYGYDSHGRLITTTVTKLNGVTLDTPLVTTETYDAMNLRIHSPQF